jgi:hypothetical protein
LHAVRLAATDFKAATVGRADLNLHKNEIERPGVTSPGRVFVTIDLVGCGGSDKAAAPANNSSSASSASSDTSKVSQKDLDAAREKFQIRKDLQIEPKGYAFHQLTADVSGTFFKFVAKTDKIEKVFTPSTDLSKFHAHFFLMESPRDPWFDVRDKELPGGNVKLPNNEEMSVLYVDNKDGTLTVYIEM